MKHLVLLLTTLFFLFTNVNGQKNLAALKELLRSADSVIIIYHEVTAGIVIKKDNETNNKASLSKLILNGKLNSKIIHQKSTVIDTSIQRLSKIITRPFEDTIVERSPCHICEHSILIFIRGKISFVDISFDCRTIVDTSKDINISEFDFDNRKWTELIAFFEIHGVKAY